MKAVCEREAHSRAHCEKRGGHWADSRQQWQKGSRLREDGEQWAGRLAGTLGGAFEGAVGPLYPMAEATAPQAPLRDQKPTERFL